MKHTLLGSLVGSLLAIVCLSSENAHAKNGCNTFDFGQTVCDCAGLGKDPQTISLDHATVCAVDSDAARFQTMSLCDKACSKKGYSRFTPKPSVASPTAGAKCGCQTV